MNDSYFSRSWTARIVIIAMAFTGLTSLAVFNTSNPAHASSYNSDLFNPGHIIADRYFYDSKSMSVSQIQSFLNQRVPTCSPLATEPCLKDYRGTIEARDATNRCDAVVRRTDQSAASIIATVADACGISPKVLLVTLQKEQSLVTSTSPSARQYEIAAGYGCHDSQPCKEEYYGIFNQLYMAASQYMRYKVESHRYNFVPGRTYNIRYSPNSDCGTKQVTIENWATAALYNYTPFTPNDGALQAYPGTAPCGAYGNRNFFAIWSIWFGATNVETLLVRSKDTGEYYIVSDGKRWWLTGDVLPLYFSRLGEAIEVSDAWLSSSRYIAKAFYVVREEGTLNYFVIDRNTKVPLRGCAGAQGHEWGFSCGHAVQMDSDTIDLYPTRPALNNWVETTAGDYYFVQDSVKYYVEDASLVTKFGIQPKTPTVLIADRVLSLLPEGEPVLLPSPHDAVADGRAARTSTGTAVRLGDDFYHFPGSLYQLVQLDTVYGEPVTPSPTMQTAIRSASTQVGGWVYDSDADQLYGLMSHGLIPVDGLDPAVVQATTMPASFFSSAPIADLYLQQPFFARRTSTSEVYLVGGGVALDIGGSAARDHYSSTYDIRRWTPRVSDEMVDALPRAMAALYPGKVYRDTDLNQVWLVDGLDRKWRLGSVRGVEFDAGDIERVSTGTLAPYASHGWASMGMRCGGEYFVNSEGKRYFVSEADALQMSPAFLFFEYQPATCNALPLASPEFVLAFESSDGFFYVIENGQKRLISESEHSAITGSATPIKFSSYVSSLFPLA